MKKFFILMLVFLICGCAKKDGQPLVKQTKENLIKSTSLTLTGDLLFEQGLYNALDNYQFGTYFNRIKPYLKGDLVIGNLEVPIGGRELGVSGVAYTFNAPEDIAPQLANIGFNVFTLSNNHSNDMGHKGIVNTLDFLQNSQIETVGLYKSEEESNQIKIIESNGIKIAFLAYTYNTNIPLNNSYDYSVKTFLNGNQELDNVHRELLKLDVERAKQKADVIIAAMHWGTEFTYDLNSSQLETAHYLNELGVDLIIGNHPHCLQTMESIKNEANENETLVFYSLGNFVSAAAMVDRASPDFANMYEIGAIINLDVNLNYKTKEVNFSNLELTPTVNHFENNYTNFSLVPLPEYTDEMAKDHFQHKYSTDFNIDWLSNQINSLFLDKIHITK